MSNADRPWPPLWCSCEAWPPMAKPAEKCPTCKGLRVTSGLPQRIGETRISKWIAVTRLPNGVRLSRVPR